MDEKSGDWREATGGLDQEWDETLAGHPEATFFHSRRWAQVVVASFRSLKDESRRLETPEGPVLLPLFAWRRAGGLLTTLHSSFPYLYGGPIPASDGAGRSHTDALLSAVANGSASVRISGNPFAAAAGRTGPGDAGLPSGFRRRIESTHLLELPATEEDYWSALPTARRNDVRRLGRKGVVIEETRDPATADQVYRFYLDSFSRWGGRPSLVYPRVFYRNLLLLGGDAVRLSVARFEGRLLGGTFTIRYNGIVHYMAGYFDHESRALRPNVLIQVESILRAIRDGYRRYDFLPSGGHASVEAFKEGFGGLRTEYPFYERRGLVHRLVGR